MRRTVALAMAVVALGALSSGARAGLHDYRYNSTTQHVYARTDNLVWTAAEAQAAAAGANLATINDEAENSWVRSTYGGSRWIGINDAATEGTWVWSSGTGGTFDYGTWSGTSYHKWYNPQDGASGGVEPNNSGGEHYTELRSDTYWNDLRATHTREGVAEFPSTIANGSIGPVRYNAATNKRYALTSGADTWRNADLIAKANGGTLATVNNASENAWLTANMVPAVTTARKGAWVGFTDQATEGTWVWTAGDGGTWDAGTGTGTSYTNWNSNEPNNSGGIEHWAELRDNGRWNDLPESSSYHLQGVVEMSARSAAWRFNPVSGKLNAKTDNLAWQDAQAQAQYWGGNLATVRNASDNAWLHANMGSGWIGLTDDTAYGGTEYGNTSGQAYPPGGDRGRGWVWANGAPVTFQNWNANEPNNSGEEDYAELRSDNGMWNDLRATHYREGIAEKDSRIPRWHHDPATGNLYALTDSLRAKDAEAQALYWGGHLVTINDAAENAWIHGSPLRGDRWIGMNDEAVEGHWVWTSAQGGYWDGTQAGGSGTAYVNWNSGEPNNSGGSEDFAQIRNDNGMWNDLPENRYLNGIVEIEPEALARSIARITDPVTGRQYAVLGVMTWEEGEEIAQLLGGHLPTVRNQHENDFLLGLSGELGNHIWLGYNDLGVEGVWQWASGVLPGYENWNAGEPNDAGAGEDYTMLYNANGLWNDAGATSQYYAVVEFVPEPGTCVLLGVGLAALARRRRRRAR